MNAETFDKLTKLLAQYLEPKEINAGNDIFNCGKPGIECPGTDDPDLFSSCNNGVCGFEEIIE